MNYSDASLTRVTNFRAYSQTNTNNKPIICVEVPAAKGSELWNNPDPHFPKLGEELQDMSVGQAGFGAFKAIPVASTYRVLARGYEGVLDKVLQNIMVRYGEYVHVLTPHLLTRSSIMHDLFEKGILIEAKDDMRLGSSKMPSLSNR